MIRGRIEKALSGFYYVNTGAETLQCRARGKFRREGLSPLVGDWVQVRELGGGEGFVEAILPRKNAFSRPAVANIDQLVIIASAALPVTDPYLIDRISAIAALKDCRVLLCLNKCDLDPAEELYGIYSGSAIRVLRVSAVTGQGIDELRRELPREYIGPEDVFASLNTEPCGKHYRHAEKGGGVIRACCRGQCMVAYASGETEFLTLGQMVDRRAVAWRAPDRPAPAALPREQAALPPSGVRPGQRAVHRVFGPGTVLSFRDPIVEIRFPAKGDKKFVLSDSVQRGLLRLEE